MLPYPFTTAAGQNKTHKPEISVFANWQEDQGNKLHPQHQPTCIYMHTVSKKYGEKKQLPYFKKVGSNLSTCQIEHTKFGYEKDEWLVKI